MDLRKKNECSERLWQILFRDKNFYGYTFVRDQPLFEVQVDFLCEEIKLVILLIDSYSDKQSVPNRDQKKRITEEGYKLLEITTQEICEDYDQVVDYITKEFVNLAGYDCR